MRLNKYIAQSGVASRRKADQLTINGAVRINGKVMKEPGYDVQPEDTVEINGQVLHPATKKIYIVLNKPKGYITTVSDEQDRPTVMDLVTDITERVFPVGRLDYNTTGLLILTNDGELSQKLTHPQHQVTKTYHARVSGVLSYERMNKLRSGVDIGGFVTSKARVEILKQAEKSTIVEIEISEGKNRQVRKMFTAVGCKVQELERVSMGEIRLGRLLQGHYRKLTAQEVAYLKSL
jgi:23S rRNA pseudouridine2605 synthase